MIGQVLGSYRVVSRLGAGGMGSVWLAEHQMLGSRVAIKVLLPEMSSHRKMVQRFFDEARAATRIQDPGIVTVLDFGWHEGSAYIVMESLVGETVADRLRRVNRMGVVEVMRFAQQCAIAMAAAHARGIVHRDLKPDNLFLVSDPAVPGGERIKILDFGIAKLLDEDDPNRSRTQTGVIMGTPAFMSPEQCRGAGEVDHRTDVYALGCVVFMMLCGRPPFIFGAPGDMIVAHISQAPPPPSAFVPGLPEELDDLIARCLAKDPAARFASMTELVRAAAPIAGDNFSIETIPPKRLSLREPASIPEPQPGDTVATVTPQFGAPVTTLGGLTGQTESSHGARPWRGGLIVMGLVGVLIVGAVAFMATRDKSRPAANPAAAASDAGVMASPPPPPADASLATVPPPDAAAITTNPGAGKGSGKKRPPVTPPRTGSGSAAVKAGSAFDPYSER
ncbi:MAG: serine/threonine protein kinase [Deltaproteobacteria bacterium]|nr:serine/threonine protein kinase [Deltaproteobacteria bacterium]